MNSLNQKINEYIQSQPEAKRSDILELHRLILEINPKSKLWFLDGKDSSGKIVSNPNIGYGNYTIRYANGTTKDFYQIGVSANTSGISVYVMGLTDKTYLTGAYSEKLAKASITGYCIKFKRLSDIDMNVLAEIIRERFFNPGGD